MIEHFVKDMKIALTESKRMGLTLPGLALAERLYASLLAEGHGRKGIRRCCSPSTGSDACGYAGTTGTQHRWVRARSASRRERKALKPRPRI